MLVTRITPSCRSTASTTASSPATEPGWAAAPARAAGRGAGLEHHNRLAGFGRLSGGVSEPVRLADLLEEQADDPGLLVVGQVAEHIGGADHRLVAHGDHGAHADGPGPGEGQHRAG